MTNLWYVKNILANCDGNMYLPILHLLKVELHCKLQEKLHCVTGPLRHCNNFSSNLQSNFTLGRCKIGKNIPNICHKFTSLKSRIALQEKLQRVTGSLFNFWFLFVQINGPVILGGNGLNDCLL